MNNCYDVMYVCRRFVPSSTESPYPPSSRRGTLRYLHESTAKVAIFANLRKYLPIFSPFRPIVCAFSASFPSAHLPFFNSLIPLPFSPLLDIAQSPMPFLPEITDIPPGKSSILCANLPPIGKKKNDPCGLCSENCIFALISV